MSLTFNKLQLALLAVYVVVAVDMFGTTLVIPVQVLYAEFLGASETQVGLIYSATAAASILSSFYVGWLSDKFGRRTIFLYSAIGATVSFFLSAFARNFIQLLLSRVLAGLFTGTIGNAFAYVADIVKPADRPTYLSYVNAVLSTCFIIGPLIGGGFAIFSIRAPYFAAAGMAGFEVILVALFVEEPSQFETSHSKKVADSEDAQPLLDNKSLVHTTRLSTVDEESEISSSSSSVDRMSLKIPLLHSIDDIDEENNVRSNSSLIMKSPVGESAQTNTSQEANRDKTSFSETFANLFYFGAESPYRSASAVIIGGLGTFLNTCAGMGVAVLVPLIMTEPSFGFVSEGQSATEEESSHISLTLGYLLGMYGLLQALSMVFVFPKLSTKIGLYHTGAIGAFSISAALLSFIFVSKTTDLVPIYIVLSLGNACVRPIFPSHLSNLAPKGKNAEYIALTSTFGNFGFMFAGQFTTLFSYNPIYAFVLAASLSFANFVTLEGYAIYKTATAPPPSPPTDIDKFLGYGKDERIFWKTLQELLREKMERCNMSRVLHSEKGQALIVDIVLASIPEMSDRPEDQMEELQRLFARYGHGDWAGEMGGESWWQSSLYVGVLYETVLQICHFAIFRPVFHISS